MRKHIHELDYVKTDCMALAKCDYCGKYFPCHALIPREDGDYDNYRDSFYCVTCNSK